MRAGRQGGMESGRGVGGSKVGIAWAGVKVVWYGAGQEGAQLGWGSIRMGHGDGMGRVESG